GYLARAEYDFDNRYFLSASFRADGSSRFAEDVRWGEFYSVGVAWRLDQETFAQNLGIFDLLKLRASYGEVGNDSNLDFNALSFFASQPLLDLGNNNATEPGVLVGSLGAPLLEWETNAQTDVALEFGMFDYRLNGTIEYYNRETSNLIFDVPLPLSTGSDDQLANIGAMFNRGIEVSLSGDIIRSSNFTWTLDINASTISNEFKELPQEEIITGTKKLVVGGSIYDYFLREYYGVDPENGDPLFYLDPEADFDDPNVRIISGDTLTSIANDARRGFVGTAIPDLFGAITNKFTIGNFRLGFLLTYQIGGKTYDSNHARLLANDNYGSSLGVEALDRWQQPGDVTDVPRRDGSKDDGDFASSRFLIDSDFLALRQANLTYVVPTNLLRNIGLSALSVYASGENLFIDTARTGM
ncbi:MAG: SusC/RagA family TonB-linked outer membrane protein, partial [Bacteroidota bacterium]